MNGDPQHSIIIHIVKIELPANADVSLISSLIHQDTNLQSLGLLGVAEQENTKSNSHENAAIQKQLSGNQFVQMLKAEAIEYLKSKGKDDTLFQDIISKISDNIEKLERHVKRYEQLKDARDDRLYELDMQLAKMGINTQPHITTEIEDLHKLIAENDLRIEILNHCILKLRSLGS